MSGSIDTGRLRVALVTMELLGAHKNGGIGTATSHLALLLARRGHAVTVLHVGPAPLQPDDPWVRRYREAGVVIAPLREGDDVVMPEVIRSSVYVWRFLRARSFDLVLFPDWQGLGHASIVAKRAGLGLGDTVLAVIAHGPTEWLLEANRGIATAPDLLAQIQMETVSFRWADRVIGPSRYLLDWLLSRGTLTEPGEVLPLYLEADRDETSAPGADGETRRAPQGLAFFGRYEERKGIRLFVDAIVSEAFRCLGRPIHFVGKPATWSAEDIRRRIGDRKPALLPHLRFHTDLSSDESQAFLVAEDLVAVIPSLTDNSPCVISECIRRAIPFVATDVGGIPELISEEDRSRVLVEPRSEALARRLDAIMTEAVLRPAAPARSPEEIETAWADWLDRAVERGPARPGATASSTVRRRPSPDVSVIVTHHERPHLLPQTLAGLAAQTSGDFEVVLVDDGSRSAPARAMLARVERAEWPFRLRLLRQENRYLGAARNAGLGAAEGDLVLFMDDDNVAFPTMVETFASALGRLEADIVTSQMQVFFDREGWPDPGSIGAGEIWGFTAGPVELGLSVNCFGDANGIYKRSVFDRIGGFQENRGVGHEDWELYARAALAGLKLVSLPVPLYWYRRDPGGMLLSTDPYRNMQVVWDTYRRHLGPNLRYLADLAVRHPSFS